MVGLSRLHQLSRVPATLACFCQVPSSHWAQGNRGWLGETGLERRKPIVNDAIPSIYLILGGFVPFRAWPGGNASLRSGNSAQLVVTDAP